MALDFEVVFNKSPAPKMILNARFEFIAANPAYLKMVGKSREDLIGKFVFDVFPETQDRVESLAMAFRETLQGNEVLVTEIPFRITMNGVVKEQWWTARHALLPSENPDGPYLMQFSENVTEQVKLRDMRNAQMGEMQHRVGNLFAIVGAISRQTARKVQSVPEFLKDFETRLRSLMGVNRQLAGDTEGCDTMRSVIESQLAVHACEAGDRITIDGPDHPLSMMQSQAISMAIYELATNSMKYGAIGSGAGEISITWQADGDSGCQLRWLETGIDAAIHPERSGYGTILLTRIIPSQLDGVATREFGPNSFSYSLQMTSGAELGLAPVAVMNPSREPVMPDLAPPARQAKGL